MIQIKGITLSISGTMGELIAEAGTVVHRVALSIREAADSAGVDDTDKLKEFADDLTDAVFLTKEEYVEKKKAELFADLDDEDLPEELKDIIKNQIEKLQEKMREKEAEDGGDYDDIEMPF